MSELGTYSWKKTDNISNSICKILDISCFKHNQSTIPQEFYYFFEVSLQKTFKKKIKLIDDEQNIYESKIYSTRPKSPVIQISWNINFTNYLKNKIQNWEEIKPREKRVFPRLYFEKIDLVTFKVSIKHLDENLSIKEKIDSDHKRSSKEGTEKYVTHKTYERDGLLPKKKKELIYEKYGKLCCEICGFDFYKVYGERGKGFIECHHLNPVSKMDDDQETQMSDLSLICSNCHRMIHRKKDEWLSIDELRDIYVGNNDVSTVSNQSR